jgi:multidrug efflux pump subunit AcrA (membrane-fusion protein)
MKRRQTIIITLVIIALGVVSSFAFASMKKAPKRKMSVNTKMSVPVVKVINKEISLSIPVVGKLIAKDKIEIYSEVAGVMKRTNKDLLEGIQYRKGVLMVSINSDEYRQSLKSRKSDLMNLISKTLPDLKFDYPDSYKQWLSYLNEFDVNNKLSTLPTPINSREKFYISAKGIYKSFYDIEGMQTRLAKYKMYAPFDGVITACNIKPGTLVRAGQKLGEFVKDSQYELAVSLSIKELSLVSVGNKVNLSSDEMTDTFTGKVSRINSSIDSKTQTIMAYVAVNSKLLKEGMFLKAEILSDKKVMGFSLNRKLLQDANMVFCVENNIVKEERVNIIQQKTDELIVSGLKDGILLSTKTKNLHEGLEVNASL